MAYNILLSTYRVSTMAPQIWASNKITHMGRGAYDTTGVNQETGSTTTTPEMTVIDRAEERNFP
jgi:hypothetical protein